VPESRWRAEQLARVLARLYNIAMPRPWTVLPHGDLVALEENLKVVEGALPHGHIPRRMTVVRLADGQLVFHNAIPLREPEMQALEAWGTPSVLWVPNGFHRLDLHGFKQRYPGLRVLCPAAVREQVAKAVPVDGAVEDFPSDPSAKLLTVRGTKIGEAILQVTSGARVSLVFGDLVMNLIRVPGLDGLLFKWWGSVGSARVTPLSIRMLVGDRAAVRAHLEELAATPGLVRLIPSHGELVEHDAAAVLRAVAARL
jgi:hypothetical protein